jgi:hypothetical protein
MWDDGGGAGRAAAMTEKYESPFPPLGGKGLFFGK